MRSPRHVAVFQRATDKPTILIHLDTITGQIVNKWTLWNYGDRWVVVDKDNNEVHSEPHNAYAWCMLWLVDKASDINIGEVS